MKNKRNTYLLLASVVVIWGIIVYKIVNTLSPDKNPAETEIVLAGFKPKPLHEQEIFDISEHERDPFMGTFSGPKKKNMAPKKRKTTPKEKAPEIPLRFSGMISGNTAKENIFFVSINNTQYVMSVNDEIQGVKLLKGNAKAIRIRYNNQLKTIPIAP